MADVRLEVNGTLFGGWKKVRIQRGIEQISGQFDLSVTDKWAGQATRRQIKAGDECQVFVDGEVLITGFVDDASPEYDASSHGITVSGRDRTGDLVDCSSPPFDWKGLTLLQGATRLCKPFNVGVRTDTDVGKPFTGWKNDEGETVFETLETAARVRGLLLMADGQGGLVITRTGTTRSSDRLVLGGNVKSARGRFSNQNRFNEYTVKGQNKGNLFSTASESYQILASVKDNQVKRHRPTTIIAEDAVDAAAAKTRAKWERNIHAGRSRRAEYVVQGWREIAGQLWQPNTLIPVVDSYLGINEDMLITSVAFIVDERGTITELTVALPAAFDLIEMPEPKEDSDGLF